MSFDKTNLPDLLLAGLYKDSLVVIDGDVAGVKNTENKSIPSPPEPAQVDPSPAQSADGNIAYLGNNKKNISIIVKDEEAIHLQDGLLEILSNILNACKFNLADVAIINMHGQAVDDNRLRKELMPSVVLLFGVETAAIGLPFRIPEYKVQQFNNCAYLQAASLAHMKGSSTEAKLEKSRLWVCLKSLFNI